MDTCTNFDTRNSVTKPQISKNSKFDPVSDVAIPRDQKRGQKQITSQIIEIKIWNWTLALIFDTRNSVMKPKYQKIQNFDPVNDVKIPRDKKKGQKEITSQIIEIKKLKFGICINFHTRNASDEIEVSKISKFDPVSDVTIPPGPKEGVKSKITSQIIEVKFENLTLALILTRGIFQWWSPNIKNFKIWSR